MFQSMGYVVDVYRGGAKPEKNFFKLALFVSFFPQLVQGPISKFTQLAPTLYAPKDFDGKTVSFGLQRMLWGYFKKLVVADRIAVAIGTLKGAEYTGMGFLLLSLFYAVQIYGDFTGGIDVTIGLAETMGIKLPENFIRPYFSKNIAEYWRRWHISLGAWMKDYIFYPISVSGPMRDLSKWGRAKLGNFGKRLPVYVASIATWFVTGIWHGLNLNFVVWGMLNCFFVVLSEECVPLYEKFHARFPGLKEKKGYGIFEMLRMFWLMNLIRACDLFPNVGEYFRRVGSIFTTFNWHILWDGTMMKLGLSGLDYAVLGGSIVVLFAVSLFQEKHGSFRKALAAKPAVLRYAVIFLMFLVVILMGSYGIGYDASNFIYNQF
jgi:D-alanyl-lipoteichoic acid acyltransferase DltB (MBOAT superfamily)